MDFRLVCARLLVATYGPKFDPSTQPATPPILAMSLKDGPVIQAVLDTARSSWSAKGVADPTAAMIAARADVAQLLGQALQASVTLADPSSSYISVFDAQGNPVGHEACAWLYVDTKPLIEEFTDSNGQLVIGTIACVFLAVERT